MNEHSFVKSISRYIAKNHPDVYSWKIHNKFTNGVPDSWHHGPFGKSVFVEYKYHKQLPKRDGTMIVPGLSKLQIQWLTERTAALINCAVVLGIGDTAVFLDDMKEITHGIETKDYKARCIDREKLAARIERECT